MTSRSHQNSARIRRDRRDRGTTLIEIVVSIVLLGIAAVAVLTALASAAVGARTHREISAAQADIASVSDLLTTPDGAWFSCDSLGQDQLRTEYESQLQALLGSGVDVDVTSVAFWDGATFGVTCDESSGHRLQRLTVLATQDDVTQQLFVVKRPPPDETPTAGTVVPDHYESTFAWNSGDTTTVVPSVSTTVPPVTTTVVPTGNVTCVFSITESWGSGGNGQLYITNSSSSDISGWTVKIDFDTGSMDLWNVGTQSSSGEYHTATNLSWNGAVAAGSTADPTGGSVGRSVTVGESLPCEVVSTS